MSAAKNDRVELKITALGSEEISFDLRMTVIDPDAIPSYVDMDYSAMLTPGTAVAGTFTAGATCERHCT